MTLRPFLLMLIIAALFTPRGQAQPYYIDEEQDDPAYKAYREAYNLILNEQWKEAEKKFSHFISQYPKSDYLDDAKYWHAYALKNINRKKAIEAYQKFIDEHPTSSYYDDAVADFTELERGHSKVISKITTDCDGRISLTDEGLFLKEGTGSMRISRDGFIIGDGTDSLIIDKQGITISSDGKKYKFIYDQGLKVKQLERMLRMHTRRFRGSRLSGAMTIPAEGEKLDQDTQLKIEALYALGEAKKSQKSFQTLKEIALDQKQSIALREAALDVLSEFKKHDVAPVFLAIAKNDTSQRLQNAAVDCLTEYLNDKNKLVETLIELFNTIPKNRSSQREMIFYAIAEVGNDKAVDFLTSMAKTNDNYELRREAIYYLGSIGSEKAQSALQDILRGK